MDMINKDKRELFIYDDIGPEWAGMISATMVERSLRELGKGPVSLRINSYGGSVDEALAALEVLARHEGEVTVTIDSIAASAASVFPAMFKTTAPRHARLMIHNPWGVAIGDAGVMQKTAEILDIYRDSIVDIYAQSMSASAEEIREMMAQETWFTAEAAKEAGLVDEVVDSGADVKAKLIPASRFKNTPRELLQGTKPEAPKPTAHQIAAKLRMARLKNQIQRKKTRLTV